MLSTLQFFSYVEFFDGYCHILPMGRNRQVAVRSTLRWQLDDEIHYAKTSISAC